MPGFCVTCRRAGGLDWHREVKACHPGRTGLPGRLLHVKTAETRCTRPRLGDGRLQVGSRSTGRCCLGRMLLCLPELGHGGREGDEQQTATSPAQRARCAPATPYASRILLHPRSQMSGKNDRWVRVPLADAR